MNTKVLFIFLLFSVFFVFSPEIYAKKKYRVVTSGSIQELPMRNPFVENLLALIFEKQNLELDHVYIKDKVTQTRALTELRRGEIIDLEWTVTTNEREKGLRSIKIPIYRGLIGWRVFFINKLKQKQFDNVKTLSALKKLVAIQPVDWPDHDVLKQSGLPVAGNISFNMISKTLKAGLADYYPRSVLEVKNESEYAIYEELIIENNIVLYYPSAYYFFVNENNDELYRIIEEGFNAAIDDGSYFKLFKQHFAGQLENLNLSDRTMIELDNPDFPESSKRAMNKFWYRIKR